MRVQKLTSIAMQLNISLPHGAKHIKEKGNVYIIKELKRKLRLSLKAQLTFCTHKA